MLEYPTLRYMRTVSGMELVWWDYGWKRFRAWDVVFFIGSV